jgi:hypothetical protein
MRNVNYIKLIKILENFCAAHMEVKRFSSDFSEQLQNFTSEAPDWPCVFASPNSILLQDQNMTRSYLNRVSMTIWCVDLIQEDRGNVNTIMASTSLILNDLFKFFVENDFPGIAIRGNASLRPLNNWTLERAAGWAMTVDFEVETYSDCDIPFSYTPTV